MELNNTGYNGGSPRIRYNHNIKVIKPKTYDDQDSKKVIKIISDQYSKDLINKEDLNTFLIFLNKLKNKEEYDRDFKFNTPVIRKFLNAIESLNSDNKINNNYLQSIIEGINNTLNKITPKKEKIELPLSPDQVGEGSKLLSSFSNDSKNINIPQENKIVTKVLKAKEILKITETLKKYYNNLTITEDELQLFYTYLVDLKDSNISENDDLNIFLDKFYDFISKAYTDNKLLPSQLLFIIQETGIILNTNQPVINKEIFKPKDKISNISPGYKK